MLHKLHGRGSGENICIYALKCLNSRMQRVVLNGHRSKWIPVLSGVPQGSVLRAILFMTYVNDIDFSVCGKLLKFADDTKLLSAVSTIGEIVLIIS